MLGIIREKLKGILATVIVAILIVPFALWGVSNYFTGGGNEGFAEVNGEPISAEEYRRLYFIKRERLKQLLGNQVDFSAPTVEGSSIDELLKQEAIDEVIRSAVLRQLGYQSGYRVSAAEVQQTIGADANFQVDGVFDQQRYEEILRINNRTPQQFEAAIMRDLIVRQLEQGLIQTAFVTSPLVAQKVARDKQRRSYEYVELDPMRFRGELKPSEEQLKKFYQDNQHLFVSEAQAQVEYLELKASALPESQQLTREDLFFYYEENLAEYTRPERRKAAHILLTLESEADADTVASVMARAQALREQIEQGKSFAKVAQESSEDPGSAEQGGDLGWVIRGQFDPAVEAAVYQLNLNDVSEPVRSTFGVHLVQTTYIEPVQVKSFEEVKDEIAQLLRSQWQEEQFYELSETLASMAFEYPDSLEPAADMLGLQVQQIGWLTEAGLDSGLGANRNIVNQIFSEELLQSGLNSEPIELSPDHLIVLRVAEHQPSQPRDYQQVKAEVKEAWLTEQAKQKAQQQIDVILKGLSGGEGKEYFAEEFNLTLESVVGQTRHPSAAAESTRVSTVFSMSKPVEGEPVVTAVEDEQGKLIAIRLL
ncbi:MAG TPA: hypothetical protein DCZ03_10520, partial [Gammaproteobacteria bacterium]|nr:hypothetical protein [Gammaproteobacteria bacterium]